MLVQLNSYTNSRKVPIKRNNIFSMENCVYKLADDFKRTSSLTDFFRQINNNPKFKKIAPYMYSAQNYRICVGSSKNLQDSIDNLMLANKYNLLSAPKLIKSVYNTNRKYTMMIFNMPYTESYNDGIYKPNRSNITKYLSELIDFSRNTGLYNPEDINSDNWLICNDGTIILSDWSELREFEDYNSLCEHYKSLAEKLNV